MTIMVAWLSGKGHIYSLLVGIQMDASTVKISVAVPQKLKKIYHTYTTYTTL